MTEPILEPAPGIAIVGLAGRFPGSPDLARFWENLRAGKECITFFSEAELTAAGVGAADLADPHYVRARGTLAGVELFDAGFFGFTPREAELLDPQHRLFLETAWQALENAGYDTARLGGRTAVFGGAGAGSYLLHNLLTHRDLLQKVGVLQAMLLNEGDFLTTRVSYKLNLKGPSVLVQTACSTSLVAVHLACQSLLAGESDLALAGGVSIDTPQVAGYRHERGGVMSSDGHCRAFDEAADGTVNGSGVGLVVLKRLADAVADGDTIHAVILGSAINNDGSAKVGFTAPGVEGQAEAVAEALLMAGVEPETIGLVEAHGSGTQLGDPIEVAALTQAWRGATDRSGFCALGSVKTNIGHCNAAAGIAGLLKAVLSLEHAELPPSLGFSRPNPQIDFAASPFYVNTRLAPWEAPGPRRAAVSSFGLGGTNAHVVLEEAPEVAPGTPPARAAQLLVLSARTPAALETAAQNLAEHLRGLPEDAAGLADVAWTLQTGRRAFEHRRIAVAPSVSEAAAALADPKAAVTGTTGKLDEARPVVFLFPGLGDQSPDMARGLYAAEPLFRAVVDDCAERLLPELGLDLREVLFPSGPSGPAGASGAPGGGAARPRTLLRRAAEEESPAAARLAETAVAHPAVFVIEYALARLLMSWGVRPAAMIGYSLGEYVAACLAGVLTLPDALRVVARRARLIQELPGGAMLAVPLGEDEVRPLLEGREEQVSVAATNGPHFSVLGGPRELLEELAGRLAERGASCLFLSTTHAFHSVMMEPAVGRFGEVLAGVATGRPEIPYLSNVTGTWITEEDLADPAYWARHMRGTVRFAEGLAELLGQPGRLYLEVGPGATLGTLVKQHEAAPAGTVTVATLRRGGEEDDVAVLLEAAGRLWAAGAVVDWEALHGGERRRRVPLPTCPFERTRCWIDPPAAGAAVAAPAAAAVTLDRREDLADWFWVPTWRQAPPVGLEPGRGGKESWLVFTDPHGLGERIAARLRRDGHGVETVAAGAALAGRADYDALVHRLQAREEGLPTHVLHLWGATADEPSYDEAQRAGLLSLLFLEQALAQASGGAEGPAIRIGVVTVGAQEVVEGDRVIPARATVLGACKVIHQESRRLTCASLDVALPAAGSPAEERLIGQLLAEMAVPEEALEPMVAFRGRWRWLRGFEPVRLGAPDGPSLLRPDGAYLVTDGTSAVGRAMAAALRAGGARVAVVLPPGAPAGDEALALHAELTDQASLAAALTAAHGRFGGLDGILHTAAPFTGGLLQLKTAEGLDAVLRPVTVGAETLFAALEQTGLAPGFVLLTGSTLAFSGGLGQLDIAAAGCHLDALAQRRAAAGTGPFTVVAHWDPFQWEGWLAAGTAGVSGLQAGQLAEEMEAFGIRNAESVEALRRLLAAALPRAVVAARDLRALLAETDAFTIDVFMAQMQKGHADQEARGRSGIATPFVEPESDLERQVAAIWEELFGIRPVGREDNFLELGGHSLLAIQMATQLRSAFGVDLPVTVLFEAPTVRELAAVVAREQGGEEDPEELERLLALVEGLSPEEALQKMEELGLSPAEPESREPQPPPIPRRAQAAGEPLPLTFDQERLWLICQLDPDDPVYNIDTATRIRGRLDLAALLRAFQEIPRRHELWRTVFTAVDGRPVQTVLPEMRLPGVVVDLRALPAEIRERTAHRLMQIHTNVPARLATGPLAKALLLRLDDEDCICQLVVHHLITDWVTFNLFWAEIGAHYEAFHAVRPSPSAVFPPPERQFGDYAVWLRDWMRGDVEEWYLGPWREHLGGAPLTLDVPYDRPRPPHITSRGGRVPVAVERAAAVKSAARRSGLTPFMAVLAAYQLVLWRWSGQERVTVGSPNANRVRPEIQETFGFFLTLLPFCTDFSGDPSLTEAFGRTREVALAAYRHQGVPFARIVEALHPARDVSRLPVVQVVLLLLDGAVLTPRLGDLTLETVDVPDGTTRYDVMFAMWDLPEQIHGWYEYNADLWDEATSARVAEAFNQVLQALVADPERRLSEIAWLSPAAAHQVRSARPPQVAVAAGAPHGFVAPRTSREAALTTAVAAVLGRGAETVGVYDNLFDLGGDSFDAVRLVAELQGRHGLAVPLVRLFLAPHLAALALEMTEEPA